jgi:peptidoglycan/LPS O-acetylase OafA/YrhL
MRIEFIPLIAGVITGLIGLALIFDAWTQDHIVVRRERRRRPRLERSRPGEALTGFGVLCMAGAFLGRDTWSYSVIAVIAGTVLIIIGLVLNWEFLGNLISNRGALRRR